MPSIVIITDQIVTADAIADATADDSRATFLVDPDQLPSVVGWELEPSGLCRGDVCVPVADPAALLVGGRADVAAVARALGRQVVVDVEAGVVAISLPAEHRRQALEDLHVPAFELPDLDGVVHSLAEWRGLKKLLVTFASWCGCRYDLPGWQALHDQLAPQGFTVVAVAIDHSAEDVRPFTAGITMPVLYDPNHLLTELLAISNVPTTVWIDEDDRICRPNGYAFGTDTFRDFTGVESTPHLDAVRRWVRDGVIPITEEEARQAVPDLTDEEVLARLHFRVAAEAHRQGNEAATAQHLALAGALAPDDLTIWRAAMPLMGEDPFGEAFFARYEAWQQAGGRYHGLPPVTGAATGAGVAEAAV